MKKKQKRKILREIVRLYRECPDRVAAYTRWRWGATVAAWLLIFTAALFTTLGSVDTKLCLGIAYLAGVASAFAINFATSVKVWPFVVRYSTLLEDEIKQDLEELQDA